MNMAGWATASVNLDALVEYNYSEWALLIWNRILAHSESNTIPNEQVLDFVIYKIFTSTLALNRLLTKKSFSVQYIVVKFYQTEC